MLPYTHGGDVLTAQARYGGPVLDCSANLNPLGMPPQVGEAAARAAAQASPYPDPLCRELRAAIAAHDGVAPERVLCGSGAAELIFRLAFALRPRRALVTAPTFSEYEGALSAAGGAVTRHPLRRERNFDVDEGILEAVGPDVELVFLCTPNNPTGRLIDQGLLLRIAEKCRGLGAVLAVDECFLPLACGYAMAGLRLGYALCADTALLERMSAGGPPWSVSTPAQAAGLAALTQCPHWPEKARAFLEGERPALAEGLSALGLDVVPGQANYLLFRAAGAADLKEKMVTQGVLIRSCANYHGLGEDWYRVCVGQAEQNERLLAALREVL